MAYDAFMYFEKGSAKIDIKGETTDAKFKDKNAFEIFSFSWGASNPTTIGSASAGGGAGKVSISSFNIMKKTDASSPALFLACCTGDHQQKATVSLRKAGGKQLVFLEYIFEEVFVESVQWSGSSGGDDVPTESVSFAFGKVTVDYYEQKPDGTLDNTPKAALWDLRANQST